MDKEELFKEISKTEEHLAAMKKMLEDCEYEQWKPKEGEKYYYLGFNLRVFSDKNRSHSSTTKSIDEYNCFRTAEEAKEEAEKILVRHMLEDIARRLNKGEKPDWIKCYQKKYYLGYDQINSTITLQ